MAKIFDTADAAHAAGFRRLDKGRTVVIGTAPDVQRKFPDDDYAAYPLDAERFHVLRLRPLCDPLNVFGQMTEDELKTVWDSFYPGGSGPLGVMRAVCSAVEAVATLRGFDVTKWGHR